MRSFWKGVGSVAAIALGAKLIAELIKCCRDRKDYHEPKVTVDNTGAKYITDQLIVWKRPKVSDRDFLEWKRNNIQKFKNIYQTRTCNYCDSSLELWEGDDVPNFISGKGATSGTGTPIKPNGGGDNVACYSYNLIIDLPDPGLCEPYVREIKLKSQPIAEGAPVTVAVFDTGISPIIKNSYTFPVNSCLPSGELGWNFAYENDKTEDDHINMHGSAVAKFIIDQAIKFNKYQINLLPVKIHNKYGKGDLFSVLCGFAYAANCGAKIINASFGFYASKDSKAPAILEEFVKKHLTDKNILLVCAAGNVNPDEIIGIPEFASKRDLDIYPFYPACLSKIFDNVVTVTTVFGLNGISKVSPSQNFSNTIVDFGVNGDVEIENDYRFKDSLGRLNNDGADIFIIGSSYATPIITGIISQHFAEVISSTSGGSIDKSVLIQKLKAVLPEIVDTNTVLANFVKDGNFSVK